MISLLTWCTKPRLFSHSFWACSHDLILHNLLIFCARRARHSSKNLLSIASSLIFVFSVVPSQKLIWYFSFLELCWSLVDACWVAVSVQSIEPHVVEHEILLLAHYYAQHRDDNCMVIYSLANNFVSYSSYPVRSVCSIWSKKREVDTTLTAASAVQVERYWIRRRVCTTVHNQIRSVLRSYFYVIPGSVLRSWSSVSYTIVHDRIRSITDELHGDRVQWCFKNKLHLYPEMVVSLRKRHGKIRS